MSAADEAREKLEGVTPGPWRTFHDDAEYYLRVVRPTPIGTTGKYTAMRDITPDIEVDADAVGAHLHDTTRETRLRAPGEGAARRLDRPRRRAHNPAREGVVGTGEFGEGQECQTSCGQ